MKESNKVIFVLDIYIDKHETHSPTAKKPKEKKRRQDKNSKRHNKKEKKDKEKNYKPIKKTIR